MLIHMYRSGDGSVSAETLLRVLEQDDYVTQIMCNAVGTTRWRSALSAMQHKLLRHTDSSGSSYGVHNNVSYNESEDVCLSVHDTDVTWGEFLLCFVPR
jgi:hypothetical protein